MPFQSDKVKLKGPSNTLFRSISVLPDARLDGENAPAPPPPALEVRHAPQGVRNRFHPSDAVQFDYDAVDASLLAEHPGNDDSEEEAALRALLAEGRASLEADLIRELVLKMIGEDRRGSLHPNFLRAVALRWVALVWLLELPGIGAMSLAEIARQIGTSRAVLSSHVRVLNDVFGMMCRGQKSTAARDAYRQATSAAWRSGKTFNTGKRLPRENQKTKIHFDTAP